MRTLLEILIAKLFNNPLGRWYLGVPKGKHIYKITKSSTHYFTGELSKINGQPIICTGNCSPNSRLKLIHWLETFKPIHLCWLFLKMGWKIPKYFIGLDTGYKSPSATGSASNDWTNPANAYASDNAYATAVQSDTVEKRQDYGGFSFGIPAGATINGIEVTVEGYRSTASYPNSLSYDVFDGGAWRGKVVPLTTTEATYTLGSSTDLWGSVTFDQTDFADNRYYQRLTIYNDDPNDYTAYIDHIQVKVYYTEKKFNPAFLLNMIT